jgi:hypothetical protein
MNFRPLHDRVLARRIEADEKTAGGIIIPDNAKEKPSQSEAMDHRVRDYLIHAHNKVIAHYHKVLRANSLSEPERKRIQQSLARAETELETLRRAGNLHFAEAA